MATTMQMSGAAMATRTADGLDVVAAIWLIASPFILSYSVNGGSVPNDVVVGIIVLALAALQASGENYRMSWPSWINALLGLWLIAYPFMAGYASGSAAMWNEVIVGIVIAIVSLSAALSSSSREA